MKKLAVILLLAMAALVGGSHVFAADEIEAYADNGNIVISEQGDFNKLLLVYYDEKGALIGASALDFKDNSFDEKLISGHAKISLIDKNGNMKSVRMIKKPETTATATPMPTAEPYSCSVSIDCHLALTSPDADYDIISLLPSDGVMLKNTTTKFTDKMTVYDVLLQTAQENNIEVKANDNGINGINGLSKFDCGIASCWEYTVNGIKPDVSVYEYIVKENDEIAFTYYCDGLGEESADTCAISISCLRALEYADLDPDIRAALPGDGIILRTAVEVTENMTAYDVLQYASDENGIELDGSSSYVSGIGGLCEFDCGVLSGWMYRVNGEFPDIPLDELLVQAGDEVELLYTCDMGDDL